jgi:hypothetical protein
MKTNPSPESNAQRIARWLSDGTTFVAIFKNHDLGHPYVGERVGMPFDMAQWDQLEIGKTRAPDSNRGMGWRYILTAKCKDVSSALAAMEGDISSSSNEANPARSAKEKGK